MDRRFGYVSSGTWSLVGVELDRPVLDENSQAGQLHQRGRSRQPGPIPAQRRRTVAAAGVITDLAGDRPADGPGCACWPRRPSCLSGGPVVDVDAGEFIPPGDMPARIRAACEATGQRPPDTPGAVVRCILDSLANAYARTVAEAGRLSGHPAEMIHIVGGGCQNELLVPAHRRPLGLPVRAGPVEATALGNVAVQARAAGRLSGTLEDLRSALRSGLSLQPLPAGVQGRSVAARSTE